MAHRLRLIERGLSRYEVRGLDGDKDLIRTLARQLAAGDGSAKALRDDIARRVSGDGGEPPRGGVLNALRRSPLVGADLAMEREMTAGRDSGL